MKHFSFAVIDVHPFPGLIFSEKNKLKDFAKGCAKTRGRGGEGRRKGRRRVPGAQVAQPRAEQREMAEELRLMQRSSFSCHDGERELQDRSGFRPLQTTERPAP